MTGTPHPVSPTSSTDSPNRSARPTSTASLLMVCVHTTWRNSSGTPAMLSMNGPDRRATATHQEAASPGVDGGVCLLASLTELVGDLTLTEEGLGLHRPLEVLLQDGQDGGLFLRLPDASRQQHVP